MTNRITYTKIYGCSAKKIICDEVNALDFFDSRLNKIKELFIDNGDFDESLLMKDYCPNVIKKVILSEIYGNNLLNVILNSDKAHYIINGNKDLINGSVIEIVVTSEDDTKNIYKIKIKKASVNNSREINNYLKVVPIVGFIVLVMVALIVKLIKVKVIK